MNGRGRFRVLLGAAPGVGKTVTMLDEGRRLREAGADVVIALVETHGRPATAAAADGLETVPRALRSHRGVELAEMDLEAVRQRAPQVALVDELAHTNAPGSLHARRWQDVESLLEAGIDVITTVNVQHIESLNDVVEQITGVAQQETIPDHVLRRADQIEVVDLAPQALRDRLSSGSVYPAERIDAALSNYFRLGNLTALRELALLWLADEVDEALRAYRRDHDIRGTWEARERVVVALTGGPEGDTLLRRGARIAARSAGGELLAVHVTGQDGLRSHHPAALTRQRTLVEELGGSYHQVVGADVPTDLVGFARSVDATQLVLGASRRGRLMTALTGPGIGATVIRESGDIDVHIVTHAAAGRHRAVLPRSSGALTVARRLIGLGIALLGGPLLSVLLVSTRSEESITSDVLSYQLLVVVVALVGGLWPALLAAVLSGLTLDFLFLDPLYTITIANPLHLLALGLYITIAVLVSIVVDRAARQTRAARRAAAEAELLQTVAGSVLRGQEAVQALLDRAVEAFGLAGVRLMEQGEEIARSGDLDGAPSGAVPIDEEVQLVLHGLDLTSAERRPLAAICAQLAVALEHRELSDVAREIGPIAASDRVRGALLSALGHDLRRPLASATAAIGGLRATGHALPAEDREELLATADESLRSLSSLVTDLLDVSRLNAGALVIATGAVDPLEAVLPALEELGLGPQEVELDLDPAGPAVRADPVLLQRVLVNLLTNAVRHTAQGSRVRLSTSRFRHLVEIRVMDHGPGIPVDRQEDVFLPFQRLGDTDNTTGLGLGLALSKGFVEGMGGQLVPEDTPGGGFTMVVQLPVAEPMPTAAQDAGAGRGEGRAQDEEGRR